MSGAARHRSVARPRKRRAQLVAAMLGAAVEFVQPAAEAAPPVAPPWLGPGLGGDWGRVQSVLVTRRDARLRTTPSEDGNVRGAAEEGARLPYFGAVPGSGCRSPWLLVGALAWICGDQAQASFAALPLHPSGSYGSGSDELLRFFVGEAGTFGYRELATAERGSFDGQLEPGFGIGVRRLAAGPNGETFALTTHALWVPLRDLTPIQPSDFAGVELHGNEHVGWVAHDGAHLYQAPALGAMTQETLPRRQRVTAYETRRVNQREWLRIGDGRWLQASSVQMSTPAQPPLTIQLKERWIDVDIQAQVLTLYEGAHPVFVTLASTGRAERGELATPKGEFRIWVKLASQDMDNLDDSEVEERYGIEAVPWVMFFERGYGLHGTFWHDSFGQKRSHGCVNLSIADAKRLFDWTSPRLHAGWSAALPTRYEPGTLVRVR